MVDRSYDTELVHVTTDDGFVLDGAPWMPRSASHTANPKLDYRLLDDIRDGAIDPAAQVLLGAKTRLWLSRSVGSPATASNLHGDGISAMPRRRI